VLGRISSSVATNSNGLCTVTVGAAVTGVEGVAVTGLANENVGRMVSAGVTELVNENVGRESSVGRGTAVVVGEIVGITGTEVVGRDVGVLGIFPDEHPNKIIEPNRQTIDLKNRRFISNLSYKDKGYKLIGLWTWFGFHQFLYWGWQVPVSYRSYNVFRDRWYDVRGQIPSRECRIHNRWRSFRLRSR